MHTIARKTLETYLREKRILTLPELASDMQTYGDSKEAIFVTLYYQGRVIASSGRISPKKDTTVFECIDNTLLCLKDERFTQEIQDISKLPDIRIRTDRFSPTHRRVLKEPSELDITREGIIFLSQNYGVLSVILPHMVHIDPSPEVYFSLAVKKA